TAFAMTSSISATGKAPPLASIGSVDKWSENLTGAVASGGAYCGNETCRSRWALGADADAFQTKPFLKRPLRQRLDFDATNPSS
ncbi:MULTISPECIES: hypothetical protein, partial [Sinorhizobium]|uniref:hypothetical protein n=1 Tax=Sinorhizobium TaxID=28105 RepID=UPI001AEC9759